MTSTAQRGAGAEKPHDQPPKPKPESSQRSARSGDCAGRTHARIILIKYASNAPATRIEILMIIARARITTRCRCRRMCTTKQKPAARQHDHVSSLCCASPWPFQHTCGKYKLMCARVAQHNTNARSCARVNSHTRIIYGQRA